MRNRVRVELRSTLDELYAKASKVTPPLFAHVWGDTTTLTSIAGGVGPPPFTVLAQVTIKPNKYGNVRVIGTGIIENSADSSGKIEVAVGVALAPGVPVVIYTGDANGVTVPTLGSATVAISYQIGGLTPGVSYNVAIMGLALGFGTLVAAAHGVQIDAAETPT